MAKTDGGGGVGADRRVRRGEIVLWEGGRYKVVWRREVDGLAMCQTCTHELLLAAVDGGEDPGWVPEPEVEPVETLRPGEAR